MPTADHGKGQQGSPPANRSEGQYDQITWQGFGHHAEDRISSLY
jgi:hypothetical protein